MSNNSFTNVKYIKQLIGDSESIVLFRNVGGVGDAVMITPAITELRKQFPNTKIIVATIDYCAPIFYNNPDIDYIINTGQFSSSNDCQLFFEKGIGSLFIRLSDPCPSSIYEARNEPKIVKSRQQLFCEACGVDFKIENSKLFVSDDHSYIAKKMVNMDEYITVHCTSNSRFRGLPKWHVDYLIRYLAKTLYPIGVVLISHDWKFRHSKLDNVVRIVNSPLEYIIAVINNSLGLIGSDSMGVHVAGALGKPSYGIFGMTDPRCRMLYPIADWYRGYQKCKRQYCWYHPCRFRFCLNSLNMKDVAESFMSFLDQQGVV